MKINSRARTEKIPDFLWVTPGDADGVGPEIFAELLNEGLPKSFPRLLVVGDQASLADRGVALPVFDELEDWFSSREPIGQLSHPGLSIPRRRAQRPAWTGAVSAWAVETAFSALCHGWGRGLVTGPISKERWRLAGFPYKGHTDLFRMLGESLLPTTPSLTMFMEHSRMRVALVTDHVPMSRAAQTVTRPLVKATLENVSAYLLRLPGLKKPRISVLGLNPHAGEQGLLGSEELKVIVPAMRAFRATPLGRRVALSGPVSADGFFARFPDLKADAAIAMTHDQGLIPLKMSGFSEAIQITLGLPFIRTSVDHGTAFDIVGKGSASPLSFRNALDRAAQMIQSKRHSS